MPLREANLGIRIELTDGSALSPFFVQRWCGYLRSLTGQRLRHVDSLRFRPGRPTLETLVEPSISRVGLTRFARAR
jgi:hypothetical protein